MERFDSMQKVARVDYLIHGTSLKFLREILKKGLIPDPKKKQFDRLPGLYGKFFGVYLGSETEAAVHYALNAGRNTNSLPMYVIVQVETKTPSFSIDEENIVQKLETDKPKYTDKQFLDDFLEEYSDTSLSGFSAQSQKSLLKQTKETRELYQKWNDLATWNKYSEAEKSAKAELKISIKKLTSRFKALKDEVLDKGLGIVSTDPINFKGKNKIIGILCQVDVNFYDVYPSYDEDADYADEDSDDFIDESLWDQSEVFEKLQEKMVVEDINYQAKSNIIQGFETAIVENTTVFISLYNKAPSTVFRMFKEISNGMENYAILVDRNGKILG